MRTDVKVGLALGALFLIVAVSYYGTKKRDKGLELTEGANQNISKSQLDAVVQSKAQKSPAKVTKPKRTQTARNTTKNTPPTNPGATRRTAPARPKRGANTSREVASRPRGNQRATQSAGQPAAGEDVDDASPDRLPDGFRPVGTNGGVAQSQPRAPRRGQGQRIPQRAQQRVQRPDRTPSATRQAGEAARAPAQERSQQLPASRKPAKTRANNAPVKIHEVQPGDSFARLAERYLGSQSEVQKLIDANPDVDPRRMQIGTKIIIPSADAAPARSQPRPTKRRPARSGNGDSYVISAGDTLYDVAVKKLGDGSRWREIHDLNKSVIGDDPHVLKVGMVLAMPSR